jgi:hypothetical protein
MKVLFWISFKILRLNKELSIKDVEKMVEG